MLKKIFLSSFLFFISCASQDTLVFSEGSYLYQGKEQYIVGFSHENVDNTTIQQTGEILGFLIRQLPSQLKTNSVYVEGLSGYLFPDFHRIGDALFLSSGYYQNKTLIYAYLASLYREYLQRDKQNALLPLTDIQKIFEDQQLTRNEQDKLMSYFVQYSIDKMFFVSLLELLERPDRYFYPQNTQSELYQTLVFPELNLFWENLSFRFGKEQVLSVAENSYTPEFFHTSFGEETYQLEQGVVNAAEEKSEDLFLKKDQEALDQLNQVLDLYLSGSKKSLMGN